MSWARPGSAGGALGRPGGVGSCKVYAPVNPHTKYMRIYGTARESEMMKIVTDFQWSNRRPALLNLSGTKPRPFLEISDQGQLRSKGTKKNSVMKVVNRRGERWLPTGPPSPPPPVQVPPLRPNLAAYGFGQLSQFEDDTRRKNERNYFSLSAP